MSVVRGAAAVRCGVGDARPSYDTSPAAPHCALGTIHPLPAASIRLQCFKHSIALASNKGFPRST